MGINFMFVTNRIWKSQKFGSIELQRDWLTKTYTNFQEFLQNLKCYPVDTMKI